MTGFDIRGRRKQKKEIFEMEPDDSPEDAFITEDDFEEEEKAQEEEWIYAN